jgi:hypothetical protein
MKEIIIILLTIIVMIFTMNAGENTLKFAEDHALPEHDTLFYGLYDASDIKLIETIIVYDLTEEGVWITDFINESEILLDAVTLKPISGSKMFHNAGQAIIIGTLVTEDSIYAHLLAKNEKDAADSTAPFQHNETRSLPIPKSAFLHNDQLLYSFPAIDFTQKRHDFKLFVPASVSFIDVAAIIGKPEKITTPAGEFEAYPVTFDFGTVKQKAWYELEEPNRMLIYDNGTLQYRFEKG